MYVSYKVVPYKKGVENGGESGHNRTNIAV